VQKGVGGPLMDFGGNAIGMNFYDKKGTPFLPGFIVLKCLQHFANFGYVFCTFTLLITVLIKCSLNSFLYQGKCSPTCSFFKKKIMPHALCSIDE
jgi:hypothetical protein